MLALMCMMYFIAFIDRVNISIASTVFGPEFGLNNTQVGLIISAFALPYLVFQVLGGLVGDRVGPRWTLTVSVVTMAVATIAIGLVGGLISMVAARVVLGIGEVRRSPSPRAQCRAGYRGSVAVGRKASRTARPASAMPSVHRSSPSSWSRCPGEALS
jgi:MFS family permease